MHRKYLWQDHLLHQGIAFFLFAPLFLKAMELAKDEHATVMFVPFVGSVEIYEFPPEVSLFLGALSVGISLCFFAGVVLRQLRMNRFFRGSVEVLFLSFGPAFAASVIEGAAGGTVELLKQTNQTVALTYFTIGAIVFLVVEGYWIIGVARWVRSKRTARGEGHPTRRNLRKAFWNSLPNAFGYKWKIEEWRARRRLEKVEAKFRKDLEDAKNWEQENYIYSGWAHELTDLGEEYRSLLTRHWLKRARDHFVQVPDTPYGQKESDEPNEYWERAETITRQWLLTDRGISHIRSLVRQERAYNNEMFFKLAAVVLGVLAVAVPVLTRGS